MTGPGQLPPDKVAEVDQQISMYGTNLDTMINLYKALLGQFGTAGAQVALAKSFTKQREANPQKASAAFQNILLAAIARLADERSLDEQ